jgi:hypothetical protein
MVQDSGSRSQGSGKNFDDASAGASRATNIFTPSGQDVAGKRERKNAVTLKIEGTTRECL